ncbi:transcription antitermination factor NusB [Desulfurobacterium indicum]|uniref:Transcription antitermination protein NusB n=1 Tax=Desulfurobacterium indicum TaxID=1914305 RepID=A0A1R1MM80_9BACT|nr:transcription antitermination factor NusB [Desulfurobacterium indicum]OMH40925.1 transcription antitermination factor NusB [Desulfurobacterium indicum]
MPLSNKDKRRAREHAILMLYQYDVGHFEPEEVKSFYREETEGESSEVLSLAESLFDAVVSNKEEVDTVISKFIKKGWSLDRLLPVDRAILRLATTEILKGSFSPVPAIINDAIEIAKEYGEDEKSPKFINAILDRIAKER